ncbi:hypothetical protein Daudx_1673 [Candidatus Desulforudis audaxviator]|nr:hypothetical protein Daudx_1673 [Candidatus Desulforudis audaxviator]
MYLIDTNIWLERLLVVSLYGPGDEELEFVYDDTSGTRSLDEQDWDNLDENP